MERLISQGATALIIDVRDNPGGVLQSAIDTASLFLEPGSLVVSTEGRGRSRDRRFYARGGDWDPDFPLLILMNRNSASAAEILAGALRDHGRAVLLGETSRGKGSVQTVFSLRGGEGVRLTTAMYFLPGGQTIHEVGVSPDYEVSLDEEERIHLFLHRQHGHRFSPERFREEFGFDPPDDRQLEEAVQLLRQPLAALP